MRKKTETPQITAETNVQNALDLLFGKEAAVTAALMHQGLTHPNPKITDGAVEALINKDNTLEDVLIYADALNALLKRDTARHGMTSMRILINLSFMSRPSNEKYDLSALAPGLNAILESEDSPLIGMACDIIRRQ